MGERDIIFQSAKQLFDAIEADPDVVRYRELSVRVRNDRILQELLARLIEMGRSLSERAVAGEENVPQSAEAELLRKEFDLHPEIRDFLEAQKNYQELMTAVQRLVSSELVQ
jgi:cell fate (sporulation/competence/biofilm development) regulator YlbF (YheA/YmcA/DUF963 family)